jgi:hypothetical protein
VNELLRRLKVRDMCFDLMLQFCDRAREEGRIKVAQDAYEIACMFYRGLRSAPGTLTLAVSGWLTDDRQKLLSDIEREIDLLIGERTTGCFVVKVEEPPVVADDRIE